MKTPNELYQHLIQQFVSYSTDELIDLNNDLVRNTSWGHNKATFRTAVLNALARRGIDLSMIISRDDGFTSFKITPVKLDNEKTLVPFD